MSHVTGSGGHVEWTNNDVPPHKWTPTATDGYKAWLKDCQGQKTGTAGTEQTTQPSTGSNPENRGLDKMSSIWTQTAKSAYEHFLKVHRSVGTKGLEKVQANQLSEMLKASECKLSDIKGAISEGSGTKRPKATAACLALSQAYGQLAHSIASKGRHRDELRLTAIEDRREFYQSAYDMITGGGTEPEGRALEDQSSEMEQRLREEKNRHNYGYSWKPYGKFRLLFAEDTSKH